MLLLIAAYLDAALTNHDQVITAVQGRAEAQTVGEHAGAKGLSPIAALQQGAHTAYQGNRSVSADAATGQRDMIVYC